MPTAQPGLAALNHGAATLGSLSCGSAGNCSADGSYTDSSGLVQAFVPTETNGTWGTAREVPGTAALNVGGIAEITSVSCPSAGNCTAIGTYTGGQVDTFPFVVSEVNGTWGTAVQIPAIGAIDMASPARAQCRAPRRATAARPGST